MKNKIFWIITITLIGIGCGIMVIALAMVDFDIRGFGKDENYKQMSYEVESNQVKKIIFSNIERKIDIEDSMDENIHITYYNNEKVKEIYEITLENNILKMRKKPMLVIMQLNPLESIPIKNVDIIVQIPKNSNIIIEK